MIKIIVKRDGTKQEFDPVKLNKWAEWSCQGEEASWAAIAGIAIGNLPEECTSEQLQKKPDKRGRVPNQRRILL